MQKRRTYQQLQTEERMTIASMKQQGSSVRAMARTLGRSASTVSRELTRNTCSVVGYASAPAQSLSTSRREAARPCPKLHPQSMSWRVVLTLLEWKSLFQFRFEPGAARDRQCEASRSVVDRPSISGRLRGVDDEIH